MRATVRLRVCLGAGPLRVHVCPCVRQRRSAAALLRGAARCRTARSPLVRFNQCSETQLASRLDAGARSQLAAVAAAAAARCCPFARLASDMEAARARCSLNLATAWRFKRAAASNMCARSLLFVLAAAASR